ncbi:hypothetical protein [Microscilla marina]|uniref:Uncharacterized protein n=1 Tax=Microscilla marina ATCC 23134 TaxID=313606 RepID=A1ZCZ2_MICM2|nr:hypothetical protein [Microscilla marina]EAY31531.1 hypothetical protein M23134_05037 [Microscilla marina ATCC 23134]
MIQKLVFDDADITEQEGINKIYSINEVLGEYESYISGDEMNQLVWYSDNKQTAIIYIDDFIIDLSYFLINSLGECQLETGINKIKTKVKLLNLDQITNILDQTSLTVQKYIYYTKCLIITLSESNDYHPIFFDILCKAQPGASVSRLCLFSRKHLASMFLQKTNIQACIGYLGFACASTVAPSQARSASTNCLFVIVRLKLPLHLNLNQCGSVDKPS